MTARRLLIAVLGLAVALVVAMLVVDLTGRQLAASGNARLQGAEERAS